jgi:hypothetical protein
MNIYRKTAQSFFWHGAEGLYFSENALVGYHYWLMKRAQSEEA